MASSSKQKSTLAYPGEQLIKDLISLRQEQKLSQAEIGRRMGVSRQRVHNIEHGYDGCPSLETVNKYAEAVGARLVIVENDSPYCNCYVDVLD